ncbi:unnamed protein product [Angiostrongylus costaricensis]|uniref:HNH endonuclease n=1 Tax=Angiostrongylus costaricensis TaxID=334426 RepID=A0A0R3Q026_ANGCS|nr:unnamed protein product [Angiostrongylus costaricensis]
MLLVFINEDTAAVIQVVNGIEGKHGTFVAVKKTGYSGIHWILRDGLTIAHHETAHIYLTNSQIRIPDFINLRSKPLSGLSKHIDGSERFGIIQ